MRIARFVLVLLPLAAVYSCGDEASVPGEGADAGVDQAEGDATVLVDSAVPDAADAARDGDADSGADANACRGDIIFLSRTFNEIWKVAPDGGGEVRVSPEGLAFFTPRWIQQCGRIVALDTTLGSIVTFAPDGGGLVTLRGGYDPTWDTAHGRIVFAAPGARRGLLSMLPDGGDVVTILPEAGVSNALPAVSPDGTLVAVRNGADLAIVENKANGAIVKTLPFCNYPAWHPDGSRLVCAKSYANDDNRIGVIQVATGNYVDLTDGSFFDFTPTWSPDGSQIAFGRGPGTSSTGAEIHVMNADGSNVHKITARAAQEPDWR